MDKKLIRTRKNTRLFASSVNFGKNRSFLTKTFEKNIQVIIASNNIMRYIFLITQVFENLIVPINLC